MGYNLQGKFIPKWRIGKYVKLVYRRENAEQSNIRFTYKYINTFILSL